jgi:hypothetical protein
MLPRAPGVIAPLTHGRPTLSSEGVESEARRSGAVALELTWAALKATNAQRCVVVEGSDRLRYGRGNLTGSLASTGKLTSKPAPSASAT